MSCWFNYNSTRFKIATHGSIKVQFDLFLNNLLSFHVNILKRMPNISMPCSQKCKHFINIYVREHNNVHLDNTTSRSERKHFAPFVCFKKINKNKENSLRPIYIFILGLKLVHIFTV